MAIQIRGAAQVTDTYAIPNARTFGAPIGAGAEWRELAQGLSNLNPALNKFLADRQEAQTEEALAEGAQLQQQHRVAFKDAVKQGLIPEGANPFLRLGYLKSEVRVKGQEYQSWIMDQWQQDGDIRNGAVDAIPDWAAQKTAEFSKQNLSIYDPQLVEEVFQPAASAGQNQLMQRHISYTFQRNEERARTSLEQEVATILQSEDPDRGTVIQNILSEAVANGLDGSDVNKIAIQQIGAAADLAGDTDVLSLLDTVDTGNGVLGKTVDGQQMRIRVEDKITNRQLREEETAWRMQQRQEQARRKTDLAGFYSVAYEAYKTDGLAAVDPFAFIEQNDITDPETRAEVIQTSRAMVQALDRDIADDDEFINKLVEDMTLDPNFDPRRISAGLRNGRYDTARNLQLWQDYRVINSHEDNSLLKSQEFKTIRDGVKQTIGGGLDVFGETAFNSRRAESDLMRYARHYIEENPNVSQDDFEDAMWARSERLVKFYGQVEEAELKRFEQAQEAAPEADSPSEGDSTPEPASSPDEATDQTTAPPDPARAFLLENLTPDMMMQFDDKYGPGAAAAVIRESQQSQ